MSAGRRPDGGVARVRAPAKVNLRLRILAREESGYHQLETIFCALELCDALELRRGGEGVRLDVEGAELGPPEENLVCRAALAFYDAAGLTPAVRIRLVKEIPAGAGLGGGSSDAAATLRALNALHGAPLSRATLLRLGAALGSDVPFFLCDAPLALAWGRGERLLELPALPPAPALVVAPGFAIGTADAYRALDEHRRQPRRPPAEPAVLRPELLASWDAVASLAENDFEAPTYARFPLLAEIKAALQQAGARIALLSGSGSALFGIFPDAQHRTAAAAALHDRFPELCLLPTKTAPPA